MYDAQLKGKNALITYSTSGIGLTMAKALCAGGCNLMLHGPGDRQVIEGQRSTMAQQGNLLVRYQNADLRRLADVEMLVDNTVDQLGSLDILINSPGVQPSAVLDRFSKQAWNESLELNLSAAFHIIEQALPLMNLADWGRVINVAPAQGLESSANQIGYVAAIHGIIGLTKAVAQACESPEITCNVICPGWNKNELQDLHLRASLPPGLTDHADIDGLSSDKALVGRDPLAQLTLFLCSNTAAEVNGAVLPVAC